MKCLSAFVCSRCCSRYDFDFFFAFQEVVNDLVKVDFLYKKQMILMMIFAKKNVIR